MKITLKLLTLAIALCLPLLSAQAQQACTVTAVATGSVPTSYDLVVGTYTWAVDFDFTGTPPCSTTVTKSCVVSVDVKRDTTQIASCSVPPTATGQTGLQFSVTLTAPLKTSDLVAVISYRDDTGTLKQSTVTSNTAQVNLQPAAPGKLRKL